MVVGASPKEEGNWKTKLWACEGKEDTFRREVLGPGHRPASVEVGLPRNRDIYLYDPEASMACTVHLPKSLFTTSLWI